MRNALKSVLDSGGVARNGWLSVPSSYSAELMARLPWESLTVDLQHGVQDYLSMVACFQGMSRSTATPLVRVPWNEPGIIGKALDAGAWGVICPMVNSAVQARALVDACLYPPKGARSNGPNRAAGYGDDRLYQEFANDDLLVIPMIETVEAVANLEEILDVKGVSGVYVGPSDLGFSHGLRPIFDRDEPLILDIYERIVKATARRGLFAGIHTLSGGYAAAMVKLGFRLVTIASDASLMTQGAKEALAAFQRAGGPREPDDKV